MIADTNKDIWNNFIISNSSPSSFLQSWEWGEFQAALGNKVYRLQIQRILQAQVIVKKLPLGRTYLEIAKGPISPHLSSPTWWGGIEGEGVWKEFVQQLKEIAKKEKAVLARINPPYQDLGFSLEKLRFHEPEILLRQREPERTILVDLRKSEEELLANMHEKARYNIRLAERKGVKVKVATSDQAAFEKFLGLLEETAKRDGITSWPRERFWKFREKFMLFPSSPGARPPDGQVGRKTFRQERSNQGQSAEFQPTAELLIGELEGKVLGAVIIMLFGDSATYLYAASSGEDRTSNAPSLVLWEAIRLAKARGMKWYDMWGVAPPDQPEHPWAGITRFKSRYVKFGVTGKELFYSGTKDLILAKFYFNLFKMVKSLKF